MRLNASSCRVRCVARSAGFQHLREQLPIRIVRGEAIEDQIAVAVDHREQVVEVVRDAAGQPAHGFHLLRLTELLLEPLQFRHVARHADQADHVSLGVAIDAFRRLIGARHARGGETLLERLQRAGLDHLAIVVDDRSRRLRCEQCRVVLTDHLLDGLAEQPRAGRVDHQVAAVEILDEHRVRRAFDDGAEQAVAFDESALGHASAR